MSLYHIQNGGESWYAEADSMGGALALWRVQWADADSEPDSIACVSDDAVIRGTAPDAPAAPRPDANPAPPTPEEVARRVWGQESGITLGDVEFGEACQRYAAECIREWDRSQWVEGVPEKPGIYIVKPENGNPVPAFWAGKCWERFNLPGERSTYIVTRHRALPAGPEVE